MTFAAALAVLEERQETKIVLGLGRVRAHLAALGDPRMRGVLCLFEGVCTGAADGYGRMSDKPAMVLLHLGPGLSNGMANLHNAKRAHTPVFNVIGEHASWHRPADAPLTMDIEALARTVSGWQRTCESTDTLSRNTADAIAAAMKGQISTLIAPNDRQWTECSDETIIIPQLPVEEIDKVSIDEAVELSKEFSGDTSSKFINGVLGTVYREIGEPGKEE